MKMLTQIWTAKPEEAQRVPALQEFQNYTGQEFSCIAGDLTGTRYLREVQRHYGLATASRLRCRYRFTNAKLAHSR